MKGIIAGLGREIALTCGLCLVLAAPAAAAPEYGSSVIRFWVSRGSPAVLDAGGNGTGYIAALDTGGNSFNGDFGGYVWAISGSGMASAAAGNLGCAFVTTMNTWAEFVVGGPTGVAEVKLWDHFTVGPGDSGLPPGTPVQLLFHTGLSGKIVLNPSYFPLSSHTSPPSGFEYRAALTGGLGYAGNPRGQAEATSSIGYDPGTVDGLKLTWDFVVDSYVGDRLYLETWLKVQYIGAYYAAQAAFTDYLDFSHTATAAVGFAPGYENISIVSDAGAPLLPEPATLSVLALGALAMMRRRRK